MGIFSLFSFAFCFSSLFISCKAFSESHFALFHFCFLGMVLLATSCTQLQTSIHSSSGTLSDLIPWIFLSFLLYNHKRSEWPSGFPCFLQFKSEFHNKDLMIWATVSFQSWFCQLYRASLSLTTKNIIILISVLTILWCSCVELSLVFWRGYLLWPMSSLVKTLLAFPLLHFALQGQTCLLLQVSFYSYLCIPVPCMKSRFFWFWCFDLKCNISLHRTSKLHILWP